MLWDLVCQFMGSIPDRYEFLYIFGVLFILYIVLQIFNGLIQAIYSILKGM